MPIPLDSRGLPFRHGLPNPGENGSRSSRARARQGFVRFSIRNARRRRAIATLAALLSPLLASAECGPRAAAADALDRIAQVMASGRFVAYNPTSLQVVGGRPTHADE